MLFHLMYLLGLSFRLNLHLVFNFLCTPESAGEHCLVDGSVRYIKFTIVTIIVNAFKIILIFAISIV